jgi:hypothetical protein
MAIRTAADVVVLPMPISPKDRKLYPSRFAASTRSRPAANACRSSSSVMAGSLEKSFVPRAIL